jgi:hypothetical protein
MNATVIFSLVASPRPTRDTYEPQVGQKNLVILFPLSVSSVYPLRSPTILVSFSGTKMICAALRGQYGLRGCYIEPYRPPVAFLHGSQSSHELVVHSGPARGEVDYLSNVRHNESDESGPNCGTVTLTWPHKQLPSRDMAYSVVWMKERV